MVTLLLVHTPPVGVAVKATVLPAHTTVPTVEPDITGVGLTVTMVVAKQPLGIVYVITAVPGLTPVTMPEAEPTVAIPGDPDVHVPPDGVPVRLVVDPTQTTDGPVITGIG